MQTETLNAGVELDTKVRRYSAEHHCSYPEALRAMKQIEPALWCAYVTDESDLDAKVRKGAAEFEGYVEAYQSEFGLSRPEAVKRVGRDVPKVRVYAEDPFRSQTVAAITEPSPRAEASSTSMPKGEVRPTAFMQIGVLLGGIPRNPDFSISFDAVARVLQAGYLDLLVKAASEKMDSLTRAQINIDGMPGITSENYPIAFQRVLGKYPELAEIYSGGRITLAGLMQLFPHLQLV